MEKIKILTFAKGNFKKAQNKLIKHLKKLGFDNIVNLDENNLPESFKNEYREILKSTKGFGYCIWKPYLILSELHKLKDDEILIYIDSTDCPSKIFFEIVINYFEKNNLLLLNRGYLNGEWTKRDTFILMDCDEKKYHEHVQLEAGIIALNKTESNIKLIEEWFSYTKNINILTETPNICGKENLINFKEHRYDQSILTNLSIKYNLKSYNFNSTIIKYNYYQPKNYI